MLESAMRLPMGSEQRGQLIDVLVRHAQVGQLLERLACRLAFVIGADGLSCLDARPEQRIAKGPRIEFVALGVSGRELFVRLLELAAQTMQLASVKTAPGIVRGRGHK